MFFNKNKNNYFKFVKSQNQSTRNLLKKDFFCHLSYTNFGSEIELEPRQPIHDYSRNELVKEYTQKRICVAIDPFLCNNCVMDIPLCQTANKLYLYITTKKVKAYRAINLFFEEHYLFEKTHFKHIYTIENEELKTIQSNNNKLMFLLKSDIKDKMILKMIEDFTSQNFYIYKNIEQKILNQN